MSDFFDHRRQIIMVNSKLVELLQGFDPHDWRAFRDLVASPYFNRNEDVTRLCDWIYRQSSNPVALSRAATQAQLFPGVPPDEAKLNHTMSFLLKLAEDFLGLESYWKDKYAHSNQVLMALGKRNLDKHYRFNLEKTRKVFAREEKPDARFFYAQYLVENFEAERFVRNAPRQFNESVQKATDNLDAFYLLEKLRRTCYMYTSQAILATPYNLQLVDEICSFVGNNLSSITTPSIEAYYRIFQLLSKAQPDEDFQKLKGLLDERAPEFGHEDLRDVYQYAINFCNIQILKVREQYVQEAFDLYSVGVESGVLLENGVLSPWHFKNIVNLALKLKKYDWTERFIANNVPKLAPEFQTDARHYNFALLYYNTGRFSASLDHLNQVEFSDIHYSLGAKVMLSKIYFEQDDYDALDSLLHAFNNFLRRNKLISNDARQAYLNFSQFLKKILRTPVPQLPQLASEVENMQFLAGKEWFLEILSPKA